MTTRSSLVIAPFLSAAFLLCAQDPPTPPTELQSQSTPATLAGRGGITPPSQEPQP